VQLDLFGGIGVRDFASARTWYVELLGVEPAFQPHATEAVWELAEHRYLYIVEDAARAGHAVHLLFVDDLDARVRDIAARGVEPTQRESYENGVQKVTYRDPDGNEVSFGGGPTSPG
jgi:catechol 2,3-dioxygenase-like lactoylglutathione lyase family enzyme